jgi:diacylglycerol kinase family enzyme
MDTCVIFNPMSARGRAARQLKMLRRRLGPAADFKATEGRGHAEELALEAAGAGYATVAAAGGDGTLHEVANGVLRAQQPHVVFGVYPLGSANDYAHSLGLDLRKSLEAGPAGNVRRIDAGTVRLANGRERYFVNSLGLGFSGATTAEANGLPFVQGRLLYSLGFFRALWRRFACPPMAIELDGHVRRTPTLSLTLAIGRREGNFVVAPHAKLDDGLFDTLHVGAVSRWEVVRFMPRIVFGRELPQDHPAIWMRQCREARVTSETPLIVHLDGELVSLPEDGNHTLEARILPGRLLVRA